MKSTILSVAATFGAILSGMAMPEEAPSKDNQPTPSVRFLPESGTVEDLNQITVIAEDPDKFGAFVYLPSLYSINEDGSIGKEVSTCELMDESARGKGTLQFKVLDPPTRPGRYAFLIKDNSFTLLPNNGNDRDSTYTPAEDMEPRAVIRKPTDGNIFKNYPVDLTTDTLRILHISNSYGGNLLNYVNDLLKAADADDSKILVERLMYSGASFKDWVNVYNDKNPNICWFYRMAGELMTNVTGSEAPEYDGSKFRKMLAENKWDLIVINQQSGYAPYHENWNTDGAGGHLPELLDIIRLHQPKTPVGVLLIHSYAEDYSGNTQRWTTSKRWERIRNGVEWLKSAYDIDFVIPYGTAIENLRLTKYNTRHHLTGDGSHLASGLAQYTAGCCYFERVFSERFNQTVWGNSLRIPEPTPQFSDTYLTNMIAVDDTSADLAQKAAFLAIHNMYELRNPEHADLSEYQYGDVFNEEEYCIAYELKEMETVDPNHEYQPPYCVYGPTGILIGRSMTEAEWCHLPKGLYIRNGEKIYKHDSDF